MSYRIVEEWEHITQVLLDDDGKEVTNNGMGVVVDEYDLDFPKYTVQDAESGENLETFDHFGDAKNFVLELVRKDAGNGI